MCTLARYENRTWLVPVIKTVLIHICSTELDNASSRQSRILHCGWQRADKRYDEEQGVMNDLRVSDMRPTQGVTSTSTSVSVSCS